MNRFLLVTPTAPWPPTSGGRQRTNLVHRALSSLGKVDTFLLAGEPDLSSDALQVLRESYGLIGLAQPLPSSAIGWWSLLRPLHPQAVNRLSNLLQPGRRYTLTDPSVTDTLGQVADVRSYDIIVTRHLQSAVTGGLIGHPRLVVDVDDLESSLLAMRLGSGVDGWLRRWHLQRSLNEVERIERTLLAHCRHVWVAKKSDEAGIGHERCSTLPNIPFPRSADSEQGGGFQMLPTPAIPSQTLLTVGMLNHVPNVQGIDSFLADAWPKIRKECPLATFRIVGSRLDPSIASRWSAVPGVTVVGFVADLAEEYAQAAATICSIPWGGGTNIKVAESLAYGRPAIVTAAAHRGWHEIFLDGESVLVAGATAALAPHAIALLGDPDRCRRMGAAGHAAVRQHLSFAAFERKVQETVLPLVGGACR
jgi:glycosyltransferase involved in cell wall biosynthesis